MLIALNLLPLLQTVEQKVKAWTRLPLSLIGRINLFKMVMLPKFTYIFRQSPTKIPNSFFTKIRALLIQLYWHPSTPKISIAKLQLPTQAGGLAAPNLFLYYIAAKLTTANWWAAPTLDNPATCLEAQTVGSYEELKNLLYRGCSYTPKTTPLMKEIVWAWNTALNLFPKPQNHCSELTPLWCNPKLQHLQTIPDPQLWASFQVKYIQDIVKEGKLLDFQTLKNNFNLPNRMLFRYLQLRHAVHSQFQGTTLQTTPSRIEEQAHNCPHAKALSRSYAHLALANDTLLNKLYNKWLIDIPDMNKEQWKETLDSIFDYIVASRDRLIQYKFLHRAYITPKVLAKISPSQVDECPRCHQSPADFIHMVWTCNKIASFWTEVADYISDLTSAPTTATPSGMLLNQITDLAPTTAERALISILLAYARKSITMKWKAHSAPTIQFWVSQVNQAMPIYRLLYVRRGCPNKFEKIWSLWLNKHNIGN
uniref:Reverse transcriptase zinc-binding domain-containing protein n=1 Tax=Xenopus tropicalis TaxID=8364 RepID=A0A803J6W9_XENTR